MSERQVHIHIVECYGYPFAEYRDGRFLDVSQLTSLINVLTRLRDTMRFEDVSQDDLIAKLRAEQSPDTDGAE